MDIGPPRWLVIPNLCLVPSFSHDRILFSELSLVFHLEFLLIQLLASLVQFFSWKRIPFLQYFHLDSISLTSTSLSLLKYFATVIIHLYSISLIDTSPSLEYLFHQTCYLGSISLMDTSFSSHSSRIFWSRFNLSHRHIPFFNILIHFPRIFPPEYLLSRPFPSRIYLIHHSGLLLLLSLSSAEHGAR